MTRQCSLVLQAPIDYHASTLLPFHNINVSHHAHTAYIHPLIPIDTHCISHIPLLMLLAIYLHKYNVFPLLVVQLTIVFGSCTCMNLSIFQYSIDYHASTLYTIHPQIPFHDINISHYAHTSYTHPLIPIDTNCNSHIPHYHASTLYTHRYPFIT